MDMCVDECVLGKTIATTAVSQSGILVLPCVNAHNTDHTHQQIVPILPFLLEF